MPWNAQRRGELVDAILNTCGHLGWPANFLNAEFRDLATTAGLPRPPAGGTIRAYTDSLTAQQMCKLSEKLDIRLEQLLDDEVEGARGAA